MEEELETFKKKIALRFSQGQIPESFSFPRIGTELHSQLVQQDRQRPKGSQEREVNDKLSSIIN